LEKTEKEKHVKISTLKTITGFIIKQRRYPLSPISNSEIKEIISGDYIFE
jgi:hypothetical protein